MSFTMDWKKLTGETKQNFAKFHKETPKTFEGFGVMGKDAKKDGHLSEKTKEFFTPDPNKKYRNDQQYVNSKKQSLNIELLPETLFTNGKYY